MDTMYEAGKQRGGVVRLPMALDGTRWHSMALDGTQWHSMALDGV